MQRQTDLGKMPFSRPAQQPICADPAADTDLLHAKLGGGIRGFAHQHIHHGHLKSGGNVGRGLRPARIRSLPFELPHQIEDGGLQAGEAEIEAVFAADGQDGGQGRRLRVRLKRSVRRPGRMSGRGRWKRPGSPVSAAA